MLSSPALLAIRFRPIGVDWYGHVTPALSRPVSFNSPCKFCWQLPTLSLSKLSTPIPSALTCFQSDSWSTGGKAAKRRAVTWFHRILFLCSIVLSLRVCNALKFPKYAKKKKKNKRSLLFFLATTTKTTLCSQKRVRILLTSRKTQQLLHSRGKVASIRKVLAPAPRHRSHPRREATRFPRRPPLLSAFCP